jgi:carboxymethylenebutenolidase
MRSFITAFILAVAFVQSSPAFSQDWALERLNNSPRHHEWVEVKRGERVIHCFVAFPEVSEKATAVLVIHENKGLTDWVRGVCDQLAERGFVAIAPDMLSGHAPDVPNGGKTSDFASPDQATEAIGRLKPEEVTADLNTVADYALGLPACNGALTVAGFCWGGGQTFRFATQRTDLKAAFVFYGSFRWTKEELAKIACPVHGFYAENDARINAGLPDTEQAMKELGKTFDPVTYAGAGHGFMRAGEDPNGSEANRKAREEAWERWRRLLKAL